MNTQKTVFNKLAKITKSESELELSAEKVDLMTVKEITKSISLAEKNIDDLKSMKIKLNDLRQAVFQFEKDFKSEVMQVKGRIDYVERTAEAFNKEAEKLGLGNQPIVANTLKYVKTLRKNLSVYQKEVR